MDEQVAVLLELEQRLRKAQSIAQLNYTIVNQVHNCIPYTQAVLLTRNKLDRMEVVAASDIPTIDYTSPFVHWIESLGKHLSGSLSGKSAELGVRPVNKAEMPVHLRLDWADMSPDHLLWLPLKAAADDKVTIGYLLLFRDTPWSEREKVIAQHLSEPIGHALFALWRPGIFNILQRHLKNKKVLAGVALAIFILMFWPVRLSTLAPVEVIAKNPMVISAPFDGVIREVKVEPNEVIGQGTLLVELEQTELKSVFEVAEQSLNVALAELKTMQHSGFIDPSLKARLAELEAIVNLRTAERDYAAKKLARATIRADGSGVAVLDDPNTWKGRPVKVGERIMLLASPDNIELEIMLAVKDSIALQKDALVKVFFDHSPLEVWEGRIRHASYEPERTPQEQMAYRLVASLENNDETMELPRIGMRGTAKVYGDSVSLFFLLFRRPITSVRQWLGW